MLSVIRLMRLAAMAPPRHRLSTRMRMEVSVPLRAALCQLTAGLDWLKGDEVWRRHKSIDISMTMVVLCSVKDRKRKENIIIIETYVVLYALRNNIH